MLAFIYKQKSYEFQKWQFYSNVIILLIIPTPSQLPSIPVPLKYDFTVNKGANDHSDNCQSVLVQVSTFVTTGWQCPWL